jgi:omega-amidase
MSNLTITLIQTNLRWENKTANLAMFEEKIESVVGKTEVVLLPEMFSTGFSMQPEKLSETMDGTTLAWMKKAANENHLILCGSIIIEENGKFYNRLIWMLPNGSFGVYDKRHLFAYGKEDEHYTPGNKRLIASVKGWKICLNVCYDLRFPVWSAQDQQQGNYDVLVYVANWPERRSLAWKTLLQARAIENQCYVAGVNRVGNDGNNIYHAGDSSVIDPMGHIIYQKNKEEDIFTCTLSKDHLQQVREKYPFLSDADNFMIL